MFLFQVDGSLATERLHRVVWIWIEAYIRVGKLERAELLCSYHIQYFQKHQNMPSTYFARLAYHYLVEIYTAQGKTACAEWGRQVLEDIHALLQPKVFL